MTEPDFKNKDGKLITEKRIAVTTEQLIEKTGEVNNRPFNGKQILDTYIYPLLNQGYIDKTESELDKRSNIYYPVIVTTPKNIKLFENDSSNNLSQKTKLIVEDITIYPSKEYLISKIQEVLGYLENNNLIIKIKDRYLHLTIKILLVCLQLFPQLQYNFVKEFTNLSNHIIKEKN